MLKISHIVLRLHALGAIVATEVITEAEATAPADDGEEQPEVQDFTRSDIIQDIQKALSYKGTQRIEGNERLRYLDRLAELKGFEGSTNEDRPAEPIHLAFYLGQWAGHMADTVNDTFPDGKFKLFAQFMQATGLNTADIARLSLRYNEQSQQTAA